MFIGFLINLKEGSPPSRDFTLLRIAPMNQVLKSAGAKLLAYSPCHVDPNTGKVKGWVVENGKFVATTAQVPVVNGSWFIGPSRSINPKMSSGQFRVFAAKNGIEIYPQRVFSSVLKDKMKTARLIQEFDPSLHPRTEIYKNSEAQLKRFLDRYRTVFLKPRFGNKGNSIYTIQRTDGGFRYSYYNEAEKHESVCTTAADAFSQIDPHIGGKRFLIQQGIRIDEYNGSPFIMRVIMLDDGESWQWVNKGVLAAQGSEIANTTQGGSNMKTIDLFSVLYGAEKAKEIYQNLREVAFNFVTRVDELFRGDLMEVAFDFVLNRNQQLKILEINTLPGMTKPGMPPEPALVDVFNPQPSEQELYDQLVLPHGTHLAGFLLKKLQKRKSQGGQLQIDDPEVFEIPSSDAFDNNLAPLINSEFDPDASSLHQVLERQAGCLLSACLPSGEFDIPRQQNSRKPSDKRFSVLRHVEAINALNAYDRWQPEDEVRTAMRRAGEYLKANHLAPVPGKEHLQAIWSRTEFNYLGKPDHVRLGWTGLGLRALLGIERFAPGATSPETLLALGDFLVWSQNDDGSMRSLFMPAMGGWKPDWSSLDYPGEAAVALLTLNEFIPASKWVDAAVAAIQYLVESREPKSSAPADYWALVATSRLLTVHEQSLDSDWRFRMGQHAEQICQTILAKQIREHHDPRLLGAFSADGETESTARYLRGLWAAQSIVDKNGSDTGAQLQSAIDMGIQHLVHACIPDGSHIQPMPRIQRPRSENGDLEAEELNGKSSPIHIDSVLNGLHALAQHVQPYSVCRAPEVAGVR